MNYEELAVFFANLAYIPRVRQNYTTFPHISTKIKTKKFVSTKVPGIKLASYQFFVVKSLSFFNTHLYIPWQKESQNVMNLEQDLLDIIVLFFMTCTKFVIDTSGVH